MAQKSMIRRMSPEVPSIWSDPFRMMNRFFNDDFFSPLRTMERPFAETGRWMPAMDVREEDDAFIVTAELPGLTKKDIELTVEENQLMLSGERRWEAKEGDEDKYHRVERSYGKFLRTFTLPSHVDADAVKAKFKDGVLNVEIPKVEGAKPHRIEIN